MSRGARLQIAALVFPTALLCLDTVVWLALPIRTPVWGPLSVSVFGVVLALSAWGSGRCMRLAREEGLAWRGLDAAVGTVYAVLLLQATCILTVWLKWTFLAPILLAVSGAASMPLRFLRWLF